MPPKRNDSGVKNVSKVGKNNVAKTEKPPIEKQQTETKKSTEDLRKQIQDLETDKRNLETENLLLKKDFNIQRIIKDLETTGGIQDLDMLGLCQDNILAYLRLQNEKLENSSITSNEKPTDSQGKSKTEEKLIAALERVNERDQKIVVLENDIKTLKEKLKASADQSSHSSEHKKQNDSPKEALREWENKYNAVLKEKETATNELNELKKTVEHLKSEAKKQSHLPEQEKTINSLDDKAKTELENKCKAAEKEKDAACKELEKMRQRVEQLEKEAQNLSKSLEEKLKEKETEIGQLKTEVDKQSKDAGLKESNEKLSTELTDIKRKHKELEKENVRLQKSCDNTTAKLTEKETKISQMEKEYKHVVEEKNREIEKLQREKSIADSKQGANANGNAKGLKEKFDTVNTELQHAKEEISELKNRLSKVVGAKVMDDNPNITDLSDENRPTKLSEKYSELYDNEWTDAFEELENNNKNETDVIQELYKLLIDINASCQQLAKSHADNIKSSVLSVPSDANGRPKTPQIGVTQTRLLKELRKTFAPFLVDSVFQHFVKTKKIVTKSKPKTEAFVKECVKICWLMNAQDPPVVLDTSNANGNFDDNRFRTYTKSGKTVDFVVWPPLLLHKDGPLLCKGVAQGK